MSIDDLISRQAAIEALENLPTWWADAGGYYGKAQPPMTALLDPSDAVSAIENLPSAQLERKPGRWIKTNNTNYSPFDNYPEYNMICSECFYTSEKVFNFCPNCGAYMEGE